MKVENKKEQKNGGLTTNQQTTDKVLEVGLCLSANLNVSELNAPIQRHRTNNKKQGPTKCFQQQTHFKNNIPGAVERWRKMAHINGNPKRARNDYIYIK